MKSNSLNRRQFLSRTAVAAGAAAFTPLTGVLRAAKGDPGAVDQVPLGKTGLKISRLGFGTGTIGGSVQRRLGHEAFNRLIRYAYDRGVTYIDTAQNYHTHEWVRQAVRGLPREKLYIQSKIPGNPPKALDVIDRYRKELDTDYIDSLLIHVATRPDWDKERARAIEAALEAKQRKWVRAVGVSCHSLPALKLAVDLDWVQVHLVRINPFGSHMDTPTPRWNAPSDSSHVPAVVEQIKRMHQKGRGVIGMKLVGEGSFKDPAQRKKAIEFVLGLGTVNAMVIGFKAPSEIDEAIRNIRGALKAA